MDYPAFLEESFKTFERLSGRPLTIIGIDGVFDVRRRRRLFPLERTSHKKISACAAIFSDRCIQHCRFRMMEACGRTNDGFVSECPFGVRQLVFPLRSGQVDYGILFLGAWRGGGGDVSAFPAEFRKCLEELPPPDPEEETRLMLLGRIYGDGVIHFLLRYNQLPGDFPDIRSVHIRSFLQRKIGSRVGLQDLAAELKLSPSHTSVLVKKLFGCSFTHLLQQLRVSEAARHLTGSELKLHEIATLCGFSSEFHLSRIFKRHTGVPPGRYRAE